MEGIECVFVDPPSLLQPATREEVRAFVQLIVSPDPLWVENCSDIPLFKDVGNVKIFVAEWSLETGSPDQRNRSEEMWDENIIYSYKSTYFFVEPSASDGYVRWRNPKDSCGEKGGMTESCNLDSP